VEKPDLTVAVVPAVDSAGFFVALHEGLFRARGLNVKFVPAVSGETVIAGQALEQGQEIADTDRAAVQAACAALPGPLGLPNTITAIMTLESYPFGSGPVGSVDTIRLQRVVDVMRQFIGFPPFTIESMLMGAGS
jgi:hypothetical protein